MESDILFTLWTLLDGGAISSLGKSSDICDDSIIMFGKGVTDRHMDVVIIILTLELDEYIINGVLLN